MSRFAGRPMQHSGVLYCEGPCRLATKYPGLATERRRRCRECGSLCCPDCLPLGAKECFSCSEQRAASLPVGGERRTQLRRRRNGASDAS